MAMDRDNEYAMQVGKKGLALRSNPNFHLQHFGFQPAELADEFSQSTMELLGSVLNAMQSKVALLPFFIYNSKDCCCALPIIYVFDFVYNFSLV